MLTKIIRPFTSSSSIHGLRAELNLTRDTVVVFEKVYVREVPLRVFSMNLNDRNFRVIPGRTTDALVKYSDFMNVSGSHAQERIDKLAQLNDRESVKLKLLHWGMEMDLTLSEKAADVAMFLYFSATFTLSLCLIVGVIFMVMTNLIDF